MTVKYLLDTNIISDLMRQPQGRVASKIAQVGEGAVATSIVVLAELRFGVVKKSSTRLTVQLEAILAAISVLPFDSPADQRYAEVRAKLELAGTPIGSNDLLIAAHALALDMVLVTDNTREFERVDGLTVENWLN